MSVDKRNFYEAEAEAFRVNFSAYKDKRIALYGIGRYTSALLSQIEHEFNVVGLLDRDESNIGKIIFGYEVLDIERIKDRADLIIINTSESYWKLIYRRIEECGVDVFYRNGERATSESFDFLNLEYWNSSKESLKQEIISHDVISFDLYDTLITRVVFEPEDVFEIIENRVRDINGVHVEFKKNRLQVLNEFNDATYTLDEIYQRLAVKLSVSEKELSIIKKMEKNVEEELARPREFMRDVFDFAKSLNKEVYIVSDMYMPRSIVSRILSKCGIFISEDHILISCEVKKSKQDGKIWTALSCSTKSILHIGDNIDSDINRPVKYGISTFYVMNKKDMLMHSSIAEIASFIQNAYQSLRVGVVLTKLFDNPFYLNAHKGRLQIDDYGLFGYVFYGMILYDFYLWLSDQVKVLDLEKLVFLARDGYFIKEDYDFFCNCVRGKKVGYDYLAMSRRLVMSVSIQSEKDFDEYVKYPYAGTFKEYLEDRFNVKSDERSSSNNDRIINPLADFELLKKELEKYKVEIQNEILKERENYLNYLNRKDFNLNFAIVDTGYHGTPQMFLSRLLEKNKTQGLYFYADLDPHNECLVTNNMKGCFQAEDDLTAEKCNLKRRIQITESLFTAPHGMIFAVDETGEILCKPKGMNQTFFTERISINEGIKQFIKDISFMELQQKSEAIFSDAFFGVLIKDDYIFGEALKKIFYNDDGMVQRREIRFLES